MTDRQRVFLTAYLGAGPPRNATRAAAAAGYAWPDKQGPRLCAVPEIAAAEARRVAEWDAAYRVKREAKDAERRERLAAESGRS